VFVVKFSRLNFLSQVTALCVSLALPFAVETPLTQAQETSIQQSDLAQTVWAWLRTPADNPATPEPDVEVASLSFSDDEILAFLGCNEAYGSWRIGNNGQVELHLGAKSKMQCFDGMYEEIFYAALDNVVRAKLIGDRLILLDKGGNQLLELQRVKTARPG